MSAWSRAIAFDRARPYVADAAGAACLGAVTLPWTAAHTSGSLVVWVCHAALVVPLAWRRRAPVAAFLALAAIAFVQWWVTVPLMTDVSLLGALFTIALERDRRTTLAATGVLEVGVVMASLRWQLADSWEASLVGLSGLVAVALLAGAVLRARRAYLSALIERAARLEVERDQQSQIGAAAERARIAREMHDVIAHSLAVMVTMADGALAKLRRDPERAAEAVQAISDIGRQALGDTRRLVGVLRDERSTGAELAPQPGLADLETLMEQLRATGLDASLEREGWPFEIVPGAALMVYRLVQEAGTNTLKHAPSARTFKARLAFDYPRLVVEAVDDGPDASVAWASGPGHGIAGMRERVALYGGVFQSGARPEGGWFVRATLNGSATPPGALAGR
jgi:signal transduction histidine kinase